jgi:glycylpeptide N-tetradecanoyltransferase
MTMADVPSARRLLDEYLTRFQLAAMLSDDEFAHWLLPRPRVVDSFVVVDSSGNVTDMCRCARSSRDVGSCVRHRERRR